MQLGAGADRRARGLEDGGVAGSHLGSGESGRFEPLLPRRGQELERHGFERAAFGEFGQAVQGFQPGQERAGLVDGEAHGTGQVQGLGDEDVVIVPLDVQQIVGVAFGQARADQDPQVILELLAGDPEPGGDLADVQPLVVDKERDELQHPLELVLGRAVAGPDGAPGRGEGHVRNRPGGELGGGGEAAAHGGGEIGRRDHPGPGTVGGQFLAERLGVAERHHEPVGAGGGPDVLLCDVLLWTVPAGAARLRHGAFPESQQASVLDVDDGGLHRQLGQAGQLGADIEPGRRRECFLLQHGHGGGQAGEPEEPLVPARPVVAHEVPLAEAAAEPPGFHKPVLFGAGAPGEHT